MCWPQSIPHLKAAGVKAGPSIIAISSVNGKQSFAGLSTYCGARALPQTPNQHSGSGFVFGGCGDLGANQHIFVFKIPPCKTVLCELACWFGAGECTGSKAAIDHITRCAAVDLAEFGIRVNNVNPGVRRGA